LWDCANVVYHLPTEAGNHKPTFVGLLLRLSAPRTDNKNNHGRVLTNLGKTSLPRWLRAAPTP